jgi:hypothetical protein
MSEVKSNCTFVKWASSFMDYRLCRHGLISECLREKSAESEKKCSNGDYKVRVVEDEKTGKALMFRNEHCAFCSGYSLQVYTYKNSDI